MAVCLFIGPDAAKTIATKYSNHKVWNIIKIENLDQYSSSKPGTLTMIMNHLFKLQEDDITKNVFAYYTNAKTVKDIPERGMVYAAHQIALADGDTMKMLKDTLGKKIDAEEMIRGNIPADEDVTLDDLRPDELAYAETFKQISEFKLIRILTAIGFRCNTCGMYSRASCRCG